MILGKDADFDFVALQEKTTRRYIGNNMYFFSIKSCFLFEPVTRLNYDCGHLLSTTFNDQKRLDFAVIACIGRMSVGLFPSGYFSSAEWQAVEDARVPISQTCSTEQLWQAMHPRQSIDQADMEPRCSLSC